MRTFLMKLTLHPLFRFILWTAATVWLIWMGISESGWVRWVNFAMALVLLDSAIDYAIKSFHYYREHDSS